MKWMFDVPQEELIAKTADELKKFKELEPPEWAYIVKTGAHKERPPTKKDWWYARAAAILRAVALKGPIGVSKLRTKYGGKKRRGHAPPKFKKGSGSIIRKIFQQLEKAGLLKNIDKGLHKGRIVTGKGKSLLERAAKGMIKEMPKVAEEKKEIKEAKEKETKDAKEPKEKETKVIKEARVKRESKQRIPSQAPQQPQQSEQKESKKEKESKEEEKEEAKVKEKEKKEEVKTEKEEKIKEVEDIKNIE